MSKKQTSVTARPSWFAESRNYNHIAETEEKFLRALLARRNDGNFRGKLRMALKNVESFLNEPTGKKLEILVELDGFDTRTQKMQKMYLGTKLNPSKNSVAEVTHFLCIAESDQYVMKLHADYDFDTSQSEKKPSPHYQIGGRLPQDMKNKLPKWAWVEEADKPRVPSLPFCTALLWHWAFREFPQYEEAAITETSWWLNLVQEAEQKVLGPFFRDGHALTNGATRKTGVFDALYTPTNT